VLELEREQLCAPPVPRHLDRPVLLGRIRELSFAHLRLDGHPVQLEAALGLRPSNDLAPCIPVAEILMDLFEAFCRVPLGLLLGRGTVRRMLPRVLVLLSERVPLGLWDQHDAALLAARSPARREPDL